MKIIIIGGGKVGLASCELLNREGHDLVLIDNDAQVIQEIGNMQDIMTIEGNGVTMEIQKEAGVDKADLVIACTSTDEVNMLCCLMARKLGARRTVARVRDPEYFSQLGHIRKELGISVAINPELALAEDISRVLFYPAAIKVEVFAHNRVEMAEFRLADQSPLDGVRLSGLYKKYKIKMLVCAVQRGQDIYIPGGDFVLRSGDRIHISASHHEMERFFRMVTGHKTKVKTVLIVGGGRIAYYLARLLDSFGMHVKIVEQDTARCINLTNLLPGATIINGDGTDNDLVQEEGIDSADCFVALTGSDEENILISLYAQSNRVSKVVTKVNRTSYADIAEKMGLESLVSAAGVTAARIVSYARAMQNSYGTSNVETLYKILDGRAEAIEFIVNEDGPYIGQPLRDLRLQDNLLIACIVRDRKPIIPDGDTRIQIGDNVVVVTVGRQFSDLKEILA